MEELTDVVAVLTVPMATGPSHAVGPSPRPLAHQTALHRFQYLQRLGARQAQGALHEFRVPAEVGEG